mmetsp:Transcript_6098/g.14537  ORF Transcript_6098/g.14537 Transcript_6098/m.14537 type:complete len:83 (-) Transcript_6098:359-607(-)|eukprot:1161550-Pelagomonas_calceolata.AAC.1
MACFSKPYPQDQRNKTSKGCRSRSSPISSRMSTNTFLIGRTGLAPSHKLTIQDRDKTVDESNQETAWWMIVQCCAAVFRGFT